MKVVIKGCFKRQHQVITLDSDRESVCEITPVAGASEATALAFCLKQQGYQDARHFVGGGYTRLYGKAERAALRSVAGVFIGENIWFAPMGLKPQIDAAFALAGVRSGKASELKNESGLLTGLWGVNSPRKEVRYEFGEKD